MNVFTGFLWPNPDDAEVIMENSPKGEQARSEYLEASTNWMQHGFYDENGIPMSENDLGFQMISPVGGEAANIGGVSPSDVPDLFVSNRVYREKRYVPADTQYMNVFTVRKSNGDSEIITDSEMGIKFEKIDEKGKIRYGKVRAESFSLLNYEYGAGFAMKDTFAEDNKVGMKLESATYYATVAAYHLRAQVFYSLLYDACDGSGFAEQTYSNTLVETLNLAAETLRAESRELSSSSETESSEFFEGDRSPIASPNQTLYIITNPKWRRYLNRALKIQFGDNLASEEVDENIVPIYTWYWPYNNGNSQPAALLIIGGHPNNIDQERLALQTYGRTKDIDTFAQKIAWRMRFGAYTDVQTGIFMKWDSSSWKLFQTEIVRTEAIT